MSIPSTEFKPDRFRTQPQRQIRSYLAQATKQETKGFLEALRQRAAIKPLSFVFQVALSLLFFILGLAYDTPLLLALAVLVMPAYKALLSLSLSPGLKSLPTALGAVLAILLMACAFFGGGYLAQELYLGQASAESLSHSFILNQTWLEWIVILGAAVFCAVWFSYNKSLARISAIIFNLLVFIPFGFAGWQFGSASINKALPAIEVGFLRLLAVVLMMTLVFWILRIKPRGAQGWLILLAICALFGLALDFNLGDSLSPNIEEPGVYQEIKVTPVKPTELPIEPSPTLAPTATSTPLPSPTPQPTNTPMPSPTPGPAQGRVTPEGGLRCRQVPFGSVTLEILEHNVLVELLEGQSNVGDRDWQKVLSPNGVECWVDVRFLEIQNP